MFGSQSPDQAIIGCDTSNPSFSAEHLYMGNARRWKIGALVHIEESWFKKGLALDAFTRVLLDSTIQGLSRMF